MPQNLAALRPWHSRTMADALPKRRSLADVIALQQAQAARPRPQTMQQVMQQIPQIGRDIANFAGQARENAVDIGATTLRQMNIPPAPPVQRPGETPLAFNMRKDIESAANLAGGMSGGIVYHGSPHVF